jgi:hypothetical protein
MARSDHHHQNINKGEVIMAELSLRNNRAGIYSSHRQNTLIDENE